MHAGNIRLESKPFEQGPIFLTPGAELKRLDAHFDRVLSLLHLVPPRRQSPVQRRARAVHLEQLAAYRKRGVFPKNRLFRGRAVPHFIDADGTRCAMAHLIEQTGKRDLVESIARERNYARVRELGDLPELATWLEANGLTLAEAARIQPEYCGTPAMDCVCWGPINGLIEGVLQTTTADASAGLSVTAVYGPVTGVTIGDVVPLMSGRDAGAPGDVVFAEWLRTGVAVARFDSVGGKVTVPVGACELIHGAVIPGPLPLDVFERALGAKDAAASEAVLVGQDPQWGVIQGEGMVTAPCGGGAGGSFGTAIGDGAGGSVPAATSGDASSNGGTSQRAGSTTSAGSHGGCAVAFGGVPIGNAALIGVAAVCAVHRVRRSRRLR